jgi:hypothetical protein
MPNITGRTKSNPPPKPHPPVPRPSPPPSPRQSFSSLSEIHSLFLEVAESLGFQEPRSSIGSFFDQFSDGGSSKDEDDDLASESAQRRGDEIKILLRKIKKLAKRTKAVDENLRDNLWNLQKAQNKILEEQRNFMIAVKNQFEFRNQLQPPNNPLINPNGEDFIPKPEPQVPFRQVEPSTPGKDLGVTVEQTGPRGESIVITFHGKAYSDADTKGPQGPPVSELGRPRPGLPTYPPQNPKPDRTPPEKPKPNPNPKPKP